MVRENTADAPPNINIIARDTTVEGVFVTKTDIRVSGSVDGSLKSSAQVVISEGGRVEGDLSALNATIAGAVKGDIVAEECVTLKGTAHIDGSIQTARLVVEEGACFNGACNMGSLVHTSEEAIDIGAEADDQ